MPTIETPFSIVAFPAFIIGVLVWGVLLHHQPVLAEFLQHFAQIQLPIAPCEREGRYPHPVISSRSAGVQVQARMSLLGLEHLMMRAVVSQFEAGPSIAMTDLVTGTPDELRRVDAERLVILVDYHKRFCVCI